MIAEEEFFLTMMDEPKISMKESSQKEKHIMLDALSLKESAISTISTTLAATPSLQLSKPKFLSHSLPNSANSSPLFSSKRKSKTGVVESPCQANNNMTLKHQLLLQELHLRKSKSCGEGRASAAIFDEFDIWLAKPNVMEHYNMHHANLHHDSFSKTIKERSVSCKEVETNTDEEFKCSALCMYLPGFGKTKQVKAKKEGLGIEGVISRNVSLEKFECASWGSSTLFHEIERESKNSYFDLPMELIKCSNNDVHAPVTSAFVFEKELKGVLKNGSSRTTARKSDASNHHVRFSISSATTSNPTSPASCNSLRKLREDLNAFIEAQSA